MTMLTPGRFISSMRRSAAVLDAVLDGVTQERAAVARDGEDGWNVIEILCHLRDFDEIFFNRAKQIVAEDVPVLVWWDHEALALERDYASQDLNEVFEVLLKSRREFVAWLKERTDDEWQRKGIHPESGEYTLLEQAMQVSLHDLNHLEQLVRVLGMTAPSDTHVLI